MKKYLQYNLIILFFCIGEQSHLFASADSITNDLIRKISIAKEDTNKVLLLKKLSQQYRFTQLDSALLFSNTALLLSEKLDWQYGIGMISNLLGGLYIDKLNYDKAYYYYYKSLKIAERLKDKRAISSVYINLGQMHSDIGNYDEAIEYFEKGLIIKQELKSESGMTIAYISMGVLYGKKKNYLRALEYSQKALIVAKKNRSNELLSMIYANIANIYEEQGFYKGALKYVNNALKIAVKLKRLEIKSNCYLILGKISYDLKYYYKALKYANKGLTIAIKSQSKESEVSAYSILFKTHVELGDRKKALLYYGLYETKNDSLHISQSAKQIAELEARNKNESNEQKFRLLSNKSEIQTLTLQKNNYLISSLALICLSIISISFLVIRQVRLKDNQRAFLLEQKALRAQINPHFFSNVLNAIQKLIPKKNSGSAHEYIAKFSSLMRKILDNSDKIFVTIDDELSAVRIYLEMEQLRVDNGFDYEINIDPEVDIYNLQMPAMMIQPYIENAIWHGLMHKETRGKVSLEVQKINNNLLFSIDDNGVGRQLNKDQKLKFSIRNRPSGMQLVLDRINAINAMRKIKMSVEVIDLRDKDYLPAGTRIEIKMGLYS